MVPARILHFYSPPPLFLWAFALSWLLLLKFYQFCLPFKKNYYVLVFSLFLVLILFISSLTLVITSLHEFSIFISFKRLLHVLSNFFLDPWLHRCTPFNLHTSMQLPKFNLLVTHKLIPLQFTNVWFLFKKKNSLRLLWFSIQSSLQNIPCAEETITHQHQMTSSVNIWHVHLV